MILVAWFLCIVAAAVGLVWLLQWVEARIHTHTWVERGVGQDWSLQRCDCGATRFEALP